MQDREAKKEQTNTLSADLEFRSLASVKSSPNKTRLKPRVIRAYLANRLAEFGVTIG